MVEEKTRVPTQKRVFELIDKNGTVHAKSHCALTLAIAARDLLPNQEQDPDRTGKGWDIAVVGVGQ